MEFRFNLAGRLHRDIRRQEGVQGKGQPVGGHGALRPKTGAVLPGVNPGVRPAAAQGAGLRFAELCQRFLQSLLYRGQPLLPLPAVVGGAVVAEAQGKLSQIPNLRNRITSARSRTPAARAIQSRRAMDSCFMRVRPSPP